MSGNGKIWIKQKKGWVTMPSPLSFINARPVKNIRLNLIQKNPNQPRRTFDEDGIKELCESIKQYGVLNPLTVRRTATGYELIAGERRLRAAKAAGLLEVPCMLIRADERESSLIALVENLQRRDLDFFEEALGFRRLIDCYNLTQEEAARRVGKTQSAVANKLRLLKLSAKCMEIIKVNDLSERHARALLRIPEEDKRLKALDDIVGNGLNVMQTEEYIDGLLASPKEEGKKPQRTQFTMIKDVRLFLNTITHAVGMMKQSGVNAVYEKEEQEGDLIVKIRIPAAKL